MADADSHPIRRTSLDGNKNTDIHPVMGNARARNEPHDSRRHRTSPEVTVGVARAGVVSWLRDLRTRLPDPSVSGYRIRELRSRYSGGAAPASHRFPWPLQLQ